MIADLMQAAGILALIGVAAGAIALSRKPGGADDLDLSDYHEPTPAEPTRVIDDGYRRRLRTDRPAPVEPLTALTAPLDPRDLDVAAPIWEDMAARQILRELGQQARMELAR